jgi:hypothetical protein
MGRQCRVLEMNSISSLSTSLTTMIFALAWRGGRRGRQRQEQEKKGVHQLTLQE